MQGRLFFAALALVVILLVATALFGRIFGAIDAPPPTAATPEAIAPSDEERAQAISPAPPAPPPAVQATLRAVQGEVFVRSAAADWTPGIAGTALGEDQSVRTGDDGEARLDFGRGIEVQMSPRSEFAVRQLAEDLARIRLDQGRLQAAVDPAAQRALQVEAMGGDAVARSQGGRFGVVADERGQLTVATERGSVRLTSQGVDVDVPAGQMSTAGPGRDGPSTPVVIPGSLFLKLRPAAATKTTRRQNVIAGKTSPGALAYIDGAPVPVDREGNFQLRVELREGANQFSVNVLDAAGRKAAATTDTIVLERKSPGIETHVIWGTPAAGPKP